MDQIYLDHNATTPVDPEVLESLLPFLRSEYGNPSSGHSRGRAAREAIEKARSQVADLIGGRAVEIVFTSGGTEASQLALIGGTNTLPARSEGRPLRILSFALEHPATLRPLDQLRRRGDSEEGYGLKSLRRRACQIYEIIDRNLDEIHRQRKLIGKH